MNSNNYARSIGELGVDFTSSVFTPVNKCSQPGCRESATHVHPSGGVFVCESCYAGLMVARRDN